MNCITIQHKEFTPVHFHGLYNNNNNNNNNNKFFVVVIEVSEVHTTHHS
jgi:hypothetical protein